MTPIESITDRSQLGRWLTENDLTGAAVEVGVKAGENARQWISTWPGHLYLVDPWIPQDPRVYQEKQDWTDFAACRAECEKLFAEYQPRITLLQTFSVQAAVLFPPESLCCVYVDANHAFEPVYTDLNAWWPKVCKGGLFSGHDDYTQHDETKVCEVHDALKRFCKERGLAYHRTDCTSWWIRKT